MSLLDTRFRIEIGVLLPTREAVMSGREETAPVLDLAARAEALGFDSLWVGDSLLARPRHEPLTLLAGVAARTRRTTLGTAVLLPALRHPLLLAHAVATLDRLAEGRLVLGVGIGPDTPGVRREHEAAGVPFAERVGRFVEGLALCRRLWAGGDGPVSVEGRYWTVREARLLPGPHQPGGPPVWMGGSAPGTLRRTGTMADGWFPLGPTAAAFREGWQGVRDAAAAAGRSADALATALYATVTLGTDAARAREEQRRFMEGYYGQPYESLTRWQGCYAGSPDGCLDWLGAFVEAGVRHVVLRFGGSEQREQLELAASALLPGLRRA